MSSNASLIFSFDIGVESIGWAAISVKDGELDEIRRAGALIFEKENCQNQQRSGFRRQRRHIAATRNRIRRLEKLIAAKGWLTPEELKQAREQPHPFPWFLAARVLQNHQRLTGWHELWAVLRWYAHNRGYDGNAKWARGTGPNEEDNKKVENANELMRECGTDTMAETVCAFLNIDPAAPTPSTPRNYFKGKDAAFPRAIVEHEVRVILNAHRGYLPGVDDALIEGLTGSAMDAWKRIAQGILNLPERFDGGLLFGQMIPRFENRIIPLCRISGEKVPSKDCPEFYRYRWAMLVNNLRIQTDSDLTPRVLNIEERLSLNAAMEARGYFTKSTLEKSCQELLGAVPINLDQMFMTPEMERALVLDPAKRETTRGVLKHVWPTIPEDWQRRFANRLRRGSATPETLGKWRERLIRDNVAIEAFDRAVETTLEERNQRSRKKSAEIDTKAVLNQPIRLADRASGRAPYTRQLMAKAVEEVMKGLDPKARDGCLEETPDVIRRQLGQSIDKRSNNHLVRHRMLVFRKLLAQCLDTFAAPETEVNIVIEVVRELQEFSGKTAQEKAKMMAQKLSGHRKAVAYLEKYKAEHNSALEISANLIKKVRIAIDLDWRCPFSGKTYCLSDILEKRVDREHIIPRSWRPSDSLESLVLTFSEINRRKGQRLAWTFIEEEGGGDLFTPQQFEAFVDRLPPRSDPRKSNFREVIDDDLRRWRRKQLLLARSYDPRRGDSGFLSGDLTRTSFLNKTAAQEALDELMTRDTSGDVSQHPLAMSSRHILHLPGSVTGATRRSWNLEGCLKWAMPGSRTFNKTELRGETHLHHALDAVTAGLTAFYLPKDGRLWEFLSFRKISKPEDREEFRRLAKVEVSFSQEGNWKIKDLGNSLKEEIRKALQQQHVVQHSPRTMRGLKSQQNIWRVLGPDPKNPDKLALAQATRGEDKARKTKNNSEKARKLLGAEEFAPNGKLAKLKGVLIIDGNYGVVLEPEPEVIPHIKVWEQMLKARSRNNDRNPRLLRNGHVIEIPPREGNPYKYSGRWRVRSIKDTAQGIMLQLSPIHTVQGLTGNILLKTLVKNGLCIAETNYLGDPM